MSPSLFDSTILRPLLAGWIMGAMVGLAGTAILVVAVARSKRWPQQFTRLRVSVPVFAIVAINAMVISWTLIGLVLGALWIATPMPQFAVGVVVAILGPIGGYLYLRGRDHRGEAQVVIGTGGIAALAFAVGLPLLAGGR